MFEQVNNAIFMAINGFAGKNCFLDLLMVLFAKYMIFLFIILVFYLWFLKKSKNETLFSLYSLILGLFTNFMISRFYFHARPFMLGLGTKMINHGPSSSFPSDHTTFMLSIAFMLLYFKKTRVYGVIFSILGLIGGFARVYCGVHFPFDIFGSILVSIFSSIVIFLFRQKLDKINKKVIGWKFRIKK